MRLWVYESISSKQRTTKLKDCLFIDVSLHCNEKILCTGNEWVYTLLNGQCWSRPAYLRNKFERP